jgi:hypothetical protein
MTSSLRNVATAKFQAVPEHLLFLHWEEIQKSEYPIPCRWLVLHTIDDGIPRSCVLAKRIWIVTTKNKETEMLVTSLQNIHTTRSVSTNIPLHFHILATCSGVNKHVPTVNKTTQVMYNKQGFTDHKN